MEASANLTETELGGILANGRLAHADAMRHLAIADPGAGTDAMASKNTQRRPAQGRVKLAQAVNAYDGRFGHRGCEPIGGIHGSGSHGASCPVGTATD